MNSEDMTKLGLISNELLQKDEQRRKDNLARLGANRGIGSMERQQPGSRPDGGMAPRDLTDPVEVVRNAMDDARRIVANYEKSVIELESKIAELQAKLAGERDARLRAEKKIEQIVHLCGPL